jgi:hypothetical protein
VAEVLRASATTLVEANVTWGQCAHSKLWPRRRLEPNVRNPLLSVQTRFSCVFFASRSNVIASSAENKQRRTARRGYRIKIQTSFLAWPLVPITCDASENPKSIWATLCQFLG